MATDTPLQQATPDERFDRNWLDWVVEQLLAYRTTDSIVEVMVQRGFPREFSNARVADIAQSPILQSAFRAHRLKAKAASFLEVEAELFRRSGFALERRELDPDEFYARYVFANRPVVLPGLMRDWPALTRWSPEALKERFGEVVIEVTRGREGDPRYEDNFRAHCVAVTFAEYVDMVIGGGPSNDYYLVARNEVLDQSGLAAMRDDFHFPPGFLDPAGTDRRFVRLWFGPAGTVTPLHCDNRNVLFAQVRGRKLMRLVPPHFLSRLANNRGCYSALDLEHLDVDRFPSLRGLPVLETVVEPGEFLFIPVGWWHEVRSLEVSMSLSFTNFRFNQPEIGWREATL